MRALAAIAVLAWLAGCEGQSAREAREPRETPHAVALGPEAQVLYERTLVRDPEPSCAALTAGVSDPVAALLEVTERVTAPPSSPIRAATCLIREHPDRIEPEMERWVSERETMGLGLLVLNHLDRFEPALAERIAAAALRGEYADRARPRIERVRPELLESASGAGSTTSP